MYYFAYGSNMNLGQMRKRCPTAKFLKRSYLEGYKFVYDGYSSTRNGPVANVVRSDKDVVWCAFFEIDDEYIKNLDKYEGYPHTYQRETFEVEDDKGNKYQVSIYLREPQKKGRLSYGYRKIVLEGARDCRLSGDYTNTFINN